MRAVADLNTLAGDQQVINIECNTPLCARCHSYFAAAASLISRPISVSGTTAHRTRDLGCWRPLRRLLCNAEIKSC